MEKISELKNQSTNEKSSSIRDNEDHPLVLENADNLKQPKQKPYSRTYLPWSLFNSFCCCLCVWSIFYSIPAINNSFKALEEVELGDFSKAKKHARIARKFNCFASIFLAMGIASLFLLYIIWNYYGISSYINLMKSKILESKSISS